MEYQVNLKLNQEQNEVVDLIAEQRGCSRAEACRWAIEQTANVGGRQQLIDTEIVPILGQILAVIQTLAAVHQKHHAATLATLRMTGQAGLCSAALADKYGLLAEIKKKHESWLVQNVGQHYQEGE